MRSVFASLAVTALLAVSCSSSRPVINNIPSADERARNGAQKFGDLLEYRHGLFGSTEQKGEGAIEVSPAYFVWTQNGTDVVGLRTEVINRVTLNCASRPGTNLCLELVVETLTGGKYFFRDRDWKAGGNRQIQGIYDYMQTNDHSVRFERNVVDEVK